MRNLLWMPLLLALSCGPGVSPEPVAAPPPSPAGPAELPAEPEPLAPSLERRLGQAEATVLDLAPGLSQGAVEARPVQMQPAFTWLGLTATGGTVAARVATRDGSDALKLEKLAVRLADMTLFSTGLALTNLQFEMTPEEEPRVTWGDGRAEAFASLRVTMAVTGSVRSEGGSTSPFQTVVFTGVPLQLRFALDGAGRLVARFSSQGEQSPSWSWASMLETGTGRFEGTAVEPGAPDRAL